MNKTLYLVLDAHSRQEIGWYEATSRKSAILQANRHCATKNLVALDVLEVASLYKILA
jgi:hypothetical protein